MIYEGKKALVLGLGESGLAMAQWLARCGATVRVADTRAEPQRLPALKGSVPAAEFVAGPVHAQWTAPATFVSGAPDSTPRRED